MLYTLGIYLYMLGVIIASPFYKKARLMVKGRLDTYKKLRKEIDRQARYVWFHAASLGEFEQGRPLMEMFRLRHPEYKILLTFFSPSGYEVRKHYDGADVICYIPLDTPGNVVSFFRLVRPEMAFFVKYEFWLHFIIYCHHLNIPVYSVSSIFRPNKVFFRWYGRLYSVVLRYVSHFFVQDEESRQLLATRGIKDNVTVVGDTRFDRVIDIRKAAKSLPLVEMFAQDSPVIVAGSSWQPDEDLLIRYINTHHKVKLILAPHVISENHLYQIEAKLERPSVRYSDADERSVVRAGVLLIDGYGLLSSIYRYGNIAYVGGGFGVGIHNVLEAAVYGMPVLIGPNNKAFREAQALLSLGGCIEVRNQEDLDRAVDTLLSDGEAMRKASEACRTYIYSNAGASDIIFKKLNL